MRLGIFSVLESHSYFFFCGYMFMIFAHFSVELLIIFLLIHKSPLYIEEINQCYMPSKAPTIFYF